MTEGRFCTGADQRFADGSRPACLECGATFGVIPSASASPLVPAHVRREEPSAPYRPRARDLHTSPLLAACARQGFREEQVIDLLARENRELRIMAERLALFQPAPVFYLDREASEAVLKAKGVRRG